MTKQKRKRKERKKLKGKKRKQKKEKREIHCQEVGYLLEMGQGQKQPSRGVLRKRCSEHMLQIYWRTPIPKCGIAFFIGHLRWLLLFMNQKHPHRYLRAILSEKKFYSEEMIFFGVFSSVVVIFFCLFYKIMEFVYHNLLRKSCWSHISVRQLLYTFFF